MEKLVVPHGFFKKERDQSYSRWKPAFWRELVQNSVDAGAKNISTRILRQADRTIVEFSDDGKGMDEQTLRDVFFRLGASSKDGDSNAIGGFGRARLLTCFSQERYSIRTQDIFVEGSGGEYTLVRMQSPPLQGCKFEITMDGATPDSLEAALREIMHECEPTLAVSLRREGFGAAGGGYLDEILRGETTRGSTRRLLRDKEGAPFARVSKAISSPLEGRIVIRANGVAMYTLRTSSSKDALIVELSDARKVLTSNRDGMRDPYDDIVREFCDELVRDKRRALDDESEEKLSRFCLLNDKPRLSRSIRPLPKERKRERANVLDANANGPRYFFRAVGDGAESGNDSFDRRSASEHLDGAYDSNKPDFTVFFLEEAAVKIKPATRRRWLPENWKTSTCQERRLIEVWYACVETAVDALLAADNSLQDVTWGVGWCFAKDHALAMRKKIDDGCLFLLSPANERGKKRYSPTSRADQLTLMAAAIHEVAHVVCEWHDTDFASMQTMITAKFDQRNAFRRIQKRLSAISYARQVSRSLDLAAA
jgi:hypothetical protein